MKETRIESFSLIILYFILSLYLQNTRNIISDSGIAAVSCTRLKISIGVIFIFVTV